MEVEPSGSVKGKPGLGQQLQLSVKEATL